MFRPVNNNSRPKFNARPGRTRSGAGSGGRPYRSFNRNRRNPSQGGRGRVSSISDVNSLIKKAVAQPEQQLPEIKHSFADFQLNAKLFANIEQRNFTQPTPIQDQTIPHILTGKDVLGIANTGTGKSGAFLIPVINKLIRYPQEHVLIVVPTRELAEQLDQEARSFSRGLNIFTALCIGGASMNMQLKQLKRQPQIIIGTPGRLKDLVNRKALNLKVFKTVVLDEVDRMLDMGFIHDIKWLVGQLATPRHSLFFTATMTPAIETILRSFTANYVRVSVKTASTSDNVDQDIIRVSTREEKFAKLKELLQTDSVSKAIIFVRTKHGADNLNRKLFNAGFKVNSIHGDKRQNQRQRALQDFKSGVVTLLVATDVAARGLDIPNVSHVINYDLPASHDDYAHRIGRTGRANASGKALTFVGAS